MLLSEKEEQIIDTCNNANEPQRHSAIKRPDTKEYILHNSIYMELWNRQN